MLNSSAAASLFVPGCRLVVTHRLQCHTLQGHTQCFWRVTRKDCDSTVLSLLNHVALHSSSVTINYFNHQFISAGKPETPLFWQVHHVQGLTISVRTLVFISTSMERCILVKIWTLWTLQATCTSFFRHWYMTTWLIRALFPSCALLHGYYCNKKSTRKQWGKKKISLRYKLATGRIKG